MGLFCHYPSALYPWANPQDLLYPCTSCPSAHTVPRPSPHRW